MRKPKTVEVEWPANNGPFDSQSNSDKTFDFWLSSCCHFFIALSMFKAGWLVIMYILEASIHEAKWDKSYVLWVERDEPGVQRLLNTHLCLLERFTGKPVISKGHDRHFLGWCCLHVVKVIGSLHLLFIVEWQDEGRLTISLISSIYLCLCLYFSLKFPLPTPSFAQIRFSMKSYVTDPVGPLLTSKKLAYIWDIL